jgi:hypothetical protein
MVIVAWRRFGELSRCEDKLSSAWSGNRRGFNVGEMGPGRRKLKADNLWLRLERVTTFHFIPSFREWMTTLWDEVPGLGNGLCV